MMMIRLTEHEIDVTFSSREKQSQIIVLHERKKMTEFFAKFPLLGGTEDFLMTL